MTNTTELNTSIATASKRIIKINDCPTLSGKETLTYQISCDDNKSLFFRVVANSGNGFFNKDWLALTDIQQTFEDWPVDSTITSFTLWSLLKGKSSNTSAFILAALKHEGIVATLKGKRRNHEYIEPTEFLEAMSKLIESDVSLDESIATNTKPKKANRSATKKSASRSKPPLKSA